MVDSNSETPTRKQQNWLSVIVPVYNEEDAIGHVVDDVKSQKDNVLNQIGTLDGIDVLFVDDGSTDRSKEIIQNGIQDEINLQLISHPSNQGYGVALQTGFYNAQGNLIAFFDGDNTFKFSNFTLLLETFFANDVEMVTGCRFSSVNQMPLIRRIGNKLFCFILFFLTYVRLKDTSSGIRIIRKDILLQQLMPLPSGLNFIIVLTTKFLFKNLRQKEVVVPYDERIGPSKLSVFRDGIRFLVSILSIVSLNNPFKMYFFGAILSVILCLYYSYLPWIHFLQDGTLQSADVHWMIIATFFLHIALISYVIGVLAAIFNRLIFGRDIRQTILGKYLTSQRLYSKFWLGAAVLIPLSILLYTAMKLQFIPKYWFSLMAITSCGFLGLLLSLAHFLIKQVTNQIPDLFQNRTMDRENGN